MKEIEFKKCNADACVYTLSSPGESNIVAIYLEDFLLPSSTFQNRLSIRKEFDVVDKGPLEYFLWMEINVDKEHNCIRILQEQFIKTI